MAVCCGRSTWTLDAKEARMYRKLASFLFFVPLIATADESSSNLAARRDASLQTSEGAAFEKVMKSALISNFAPILKCTSGRHGVLEITILFEVMPDGSVGASDVTPQGPEAECILKTLQATKFAAAPPAFVGKFSLLVTAHK
jgi:hypothetical protein